MKHLVFIVIIITFLFSITNIHPQDTAEKKKNRKTFSFSWEDNYFYKGSPSIELSYGQSDISLKNSEYYFNQTGTINLKLGWHKERKLSLNNITKYRSNFISGTYSTSSLKLRNAVNGAPVNLGFGFGSADGYGYKLWNNANLILFNSSAITWTRYDKGTEIKEYNYDTYDKRDDFNKTLRFGSYVEGGIIIPLGSMFNLQASYDRTIVFPRHMVWLHLGSAIIEAASQSLIDGFVNAIYKSSPVAAPIVSFILKNGLSYGLYELRREKMNWPFNSAEPLLFDTYKIGLKFKF